MSIEKKAQAVKESFGEFVDALAAAAKSAPPAATEKKAAPKAGKKGPTKKQIAEAQDAAKMKASEVLKKLGKDKLTELLSNYGAKKFTDVQAELHTFQDMVEKADAMLSAKTEDPAPADDDLLGDDAESESEYTAEDVKAEFLKVNNHPELGRDATKQLLGELGVTRLPELKKEKFSEAMELVKTALKNADNPAPEEEDDLL